MDSSEGTRGEVTSRRRVLRLIALSAVGAGIVLVTGKLASATSPARNEPSARVSSATSQNTGDRMGPASLRVKATYFQMPQEVSVRQDYFVLQSPAYFSDLLTGVLVKHPSLSSMIPSMMILIDGVRALPDTALRDGDEVDFIPAVAGG